MKLKNWIIPLFLISFVASCVSPASNSFCLIADPLIFENEASIDYLLDNEKDLAKKILVMNKYGEKYCGWEFD